MKSVQPKQGPAASKIDASLQARRLDKKTFAALGKLLDATSDKWKSRAAPSAKELRGSVRFDVTPQYADGVLELALLQSGEVALATRGPNMPERWDTVPQGAIMKHFDKLLDQLNARGESTTRPAGADTAPHFDLTPRHADGHQEIYFIKGEPYLMRLGPNMPEQWEKLGAQKPASAFDQTAAKPATALDGSAGKATAANPQVADGKLWR